MKNIALALILCVAALSHAAERLPMPPSPKGTTLVDRWERSRAKQIRFDFQAISVAQVVGLVYGEALNQPYMIDPTVLRDDRMVSFRFDATTGDLRRFWRDFLDTLGFAIEERDGVDFVTTKRTVESAAPNMDVYVYHPRYRSLAYLVDMLTPLFKTGSFTVTRSVRAPVGTKADANQKGGPPPMGSAAAMIDQDSDTMIFQGTAVDVALLKKLLPQVDIATGEVVIKAVVYEVSTGQSDGSAFSLALNLLGNKLGIRIGESSGQANALTLKTASIDAAFSAFSGDSRFKAVSTPRLRVKSGAQARLSVGQDVPTLGAVTFPQGGVQPVQSVEYRSSGVILSLSPVVRESGIDLTVDQQISDFVKTETGVNNSPTLTKRALSTVVTVLDGELIVLGGLTQDKNGENESGLAFLPRALRSVSRTDNRTEVLVLLQVSRVTADPASGS